MREVPSFGAWLKRRRKALDLTQAALARLVGCAVVSIRKIEADEQRPSRQTAERLAQHLQIPLEEQATFVQFARLGLDEVPPALPIPAAAQLPSRPPQNQRDVVVAAPPASDAHAARPNGTVTFLFTDIAGSTYLWEHTPEAMRPALARHDQIMADAIAAAGGYAYKAIGDAFQAAFATASAALNAAVAAQRALASEVWGPIWQLRVRMALDSGVVEERGDDYVGPLLNRTARLLATGYAGQILLSAAAHELLWNQLPEDVSLRDLGIHQLKDVTRPEHVFQVVASDLPSEFPPLRTLGRRSNNLPAQLTSFIGREKESAEIKQLIANHRLTTLTGPGGTGKTQLALHIAAEVLERYPDGAWLAELAPLGDRALVPQAVARALGLREDADRDMITTLIDFLSGRQILLILDNCEHMIEACAQLAEALLRTCSNVCILASSREVLGVAGEAPFRVPSLRTPDPRRLPPIETLSHYEAVRLFVERAVTVFPGFRLTPDNAAALAQVCSWLDGIPLALELAAARVTVLRVEQIAARLDDRFRLLTGGSRTAVPRQQTLQASIDWSYDLLAEPERVLLRRLSVFVGGWALDATEAVCAGDGIDHYDVLDVLTQLVNKSLAVAEREQGHETRYRLLETIRQYALERLAASGEADARRRQHAAYYLAVAEAAQPQLRGAEGVVWLDRLEAEHDNLRTALVWALGGGDADLGGRLAVALAGSWWNGLWGARGYWSEGWRWLEAVLAQRGGVAPAIRARALLWTAEYARRHKGDWKEGSAREAEALALFRAAGDRSGIAAALTNQGRIAWQHGDYAQATRLLEEALALHRELGDRHGSAITLHLLGDVARDQGDIARGAALLEESLALCRDLGFVVEAANVLCGLGDVPCVQGDYPRALERYWEAVAVLQNAGGSSNFLWPLRNLGWLALIQGDDGRVLALLRAQVAWLREKAALTGLAYLLPILGALVHALGDARAASALLREGLLVQQQFGQQDLVVESLEGFARVAAGQEQPVRAVRLLGAADAFHTAIGLFWSPAARAAFTHTLAAVRAQLDEATFAAAWAAGQAMSLEQAVAEAFQAAARQPEGE